MMGRVEKVHTTILTNGKFITGIRGKQWIGDTHGDNQPNLV